MGRMVRILQMNHYGIVFVVCVASAACVEAPLEQDLGDGSEADACAGIKCSNRGSCATVGSKAICNCDQGYKASGLTCVLDKDGSSNDVEPDPTEEKTPSNGNTEKPDPCKAETCSGNGTCKLDGNLDPFCECSSGYEAKGMTCVEKMKLVSFKNDLSPLNKESCASCHGDGKPKPKIEGKASDYDSIKGFIGKADPESKRSYLWWCAGGYGDKKWHTFWEKDSEEYKLFLQWEQQGAQNN